MSDVRNVLWSSVIDPAKTGLNQNYINQAQATYDPQFNSQLTGLQNALDSKVGNLEASRTGINNNFDSQINDQNRQTKSAQNNFSNQVLGRGLARSSVATSGISEFDDINNRMVGGINNARGQAMQEVDRNIANEKNAFENQRTQMDGDRMSKIIALARDLQDKQEQIAREEKWKQKQYDLDYYQAHKPSGGGGSYYRSSGSSSGTPAEQIQSVSNAALGNSGKGSTPTANTITGRSGGIINSILTPFQPVIGAVKNVWRKIFG